MKAFLKFCVITLGCALIVIAVGILLLATQISGLTKAGIERTLNYAFMTETTVDSVAVSPFKETIEIRGITVSNPEDFRQGAAMRFERVEVQFDLKTLLSDTPTVRRVVVEGAKVNLRHKLGKGTNVRILAERASRLPEDEDLQAPRGARRTFTIQALHTKRAKITVTSNLAPLSSLTLNVAPFTLTDVSKDKAVTTGDIAAIFLRSVIRETITVKGLLKPVASALREEVGKLAQ